MAPRANLRFRFGHALRPSATDSSRAAQRNGDILFLVGMTENEVAADAGPRVAWGEHHIPVFLSYPWMLNAYVERNPESPEPPCAYCG
jgi:hypothetical protein